MWWSLISCNLAFWIAHRRDGLLRSPRTSIWVLSGRKRASRGCYKEDAMNRAAAAPRLSFLLLFALTSCNPLPSQAEPSSLPSATTIAPTPLIQSTAETQQRQAEHLIDVRQVNGVGEFYDKRTN